MTRFEFVDDLPSALNKDNWARKAVLCELAEALRASPGRWAKWPFEPPTRAAASQVVHRIKSGQIPTLKDGFEAVTRDGVAYIRFVNGAPE
jgi:hypothetical protein